MTTQELELLKQLEDWQLSQNKMDNFDEIATILLQFNRNRILNKSMVRSRNLPKLEYEVKKLVGYKKQAMSDTLTKKAIDFEEEVKATIYPILEKLPKKPEQIDALLEKGKRADHNELPQHIQLLFTDAKEIYVRMSFCHMKAKSLEDRLPCDRYPFVKELKELKETLDANFTAYDGYDAQAAPAQPAAVNNMVVDAKRITANRKYISDNRKKLADLKKSNPEKHSELFAKMQERITELINVEAGMDDGLKESLAKLGFNIEKTQL